MKGQEISSIAWTALVLVAVVFLIAMLLIVSVVNSLTTDPRGFTVSFVKTLNDPYSVLEGLSHYRINDRQLLEHSIESVVTGSLKNSGSGSISAALADFLNKYERRIYIVSIDGKENILSITNIRGTSLEEIKCGENAYCTDNYPFGDSKYVNPAGVCQVGKVPADDKDKKCKSGQTCCKYDPGEYAKTDQNAVKWAIYPVVECGRNDIGICNPVVKAPPAAPKGPLIEKEYCGNGFVIVDDVGDICRSANDGQTPVCCAFAGGAELQSARIAEKADVPFLYKGRTLFEPKEYRCQEITTKCDGEYVRGLCPQTDPNIQCCITDKIRCKSPNSEYFCRDTSHCIKDGTALATIDNICPDPDTPTRESSYECCPLEEPFREDNSGKQEPAKDHGSCMLTGNTYSEEPVFGKLELTVGD